MNSSCTVQHGDWFNEIALAPRSEIDGWNGKTTFYHVNTCFSPPGPANWGETDTLIANDLDFGTRAPSDAYPDGITSAGTGRATVVHELGHQLGLGDENGAMCIMRSGATKPGGAVGPTPFPDDIAGVAGLYGTKTFTNLFASGQRWDAASALVLNNHEDPETVCAGDTFVAQVTVVNPGSASATYDQLVFLDDNSNGLSPTASFSWLGATTARQSFSTFAFSIATSGITPGSYFLFHSVDSSNQIAEAHEGDNILRYTGPVIIADCNNKFAAFSSTAIYFL